MHTKIDGTMLLDTNSNASKKSCLLQLHVHSRLLHLYMSSAVTINSKINRNGRAHVRVEHDKLQCFCPFPQHQHLTTLVSNNRSGVIYYLTHYINSTKNLSLILFFNHRNEIATM